MSSNEELELIPNDHTDFTKRAKPARAHCAYALGPAISDSQRAEAEKILAQRGSTLSLVPENPVKKPREL